MRIIPTKGSDKDRIIWGLEPPSPALLKPPTLLASSLRPSGPQGPEAVPQVKRSVKRPFSFTLCSMHALLRGNLPCGVRELLHRGAYLTGALCSILFTFCLLVSPSWAATYYVDATNGNDNNDGLSTSTAWKAIAKVNISTFNPGDYILFKRGEVWREQLTVPSSGESGNPITFGDYGIGDHPVISGLNIVTGWEKTETVAYRRNNIGSSDDVGVVLVDDNILLVYHSDVSGLSQGQYHYNLTKDELYLRLPEDADPSDHTIEVSVRSQSIMLHNKEHVIIEKLHLEGASTGLYLYDGSDNNVVRNNVIKYTESKNIKLSASSNNTITRNTLSYAGGSGHPTYHPNGIQLDAHADGGVNGSNSNLITQNTILSAYHNGVLVRDSDSNIIEKNQIIDTVTYAALWIKDSDNSKIHYNVLEGGLSGDGCYIDDGSFSFEIYNNSIKVSDGYVGVRIVDNSTGARVKNNASISGAGLLVESGSHTSALIDYNCWYRTDGNVVYWRGAGYTIKMFSDYQNASSQDAHSITQDPKFTDQLENDFSLQSISPCIDAGTDVALTYDVCGTAVPQGNGVDIGASEYYSIAPPGNLRILSTPIDMNGPKPPLSDSSSLQILPLRALYL